MAHPVILALGKRRLFETSLEVMVPLLAALLAHSFVTGQLSQPVPGRGLQTVQVAMFLALPVTLGAWAIGRLAWMSRVRRPWKLVLITLGVLALYLWNIPGITAGRYADACEDRGGRLIPITPLAGLESADLRGRVTSGPLGEVCQLYGDDPRPSPYLPGTLLRSPWLGAIQLLPIPFALLLALGALVTLGTRDRRIVPSNLAAMAWDRLRLAPAIGSGAVLPADRAFSKEAPGEWKACANRTLWGELCGQLYPRARPFAEGEACPRCAMVFRPSPRVTLSVISLCEGSLDRLNELERLHTDAYPQDEAPYTLLKEPFVRWALLADVELPDVITVAQALCLVRERLEAVVIPEGQRERALARRLALERSSRISAWLWFAQRRDDVSLHEAIPTRDVRLGVGAQRLRDLIGGRSGWKALQLDIGLIPVDLRTGFWVATERLGESPAVVARHDGGKASASALKDAEPRGRGRGWGGHRAWPRQAGRRYNNARAFWMPVAAVALNHQSNGLWVPRVEGEGLRTWLNILTRDSSFRPCPYHWKDAPWADPEPDFTQPHDIVAQPLSLLRLPPPEMPWTPEQLIGCRLSEWEWLDRYHLEMLRRQSVVMGVV